MDVVPCLKNSHPMLLYFQVFFKHIDMRITFNIAAKFYVILADEVKVRFMLMYTSPLTMKQEVMIY